MKRIWNILLPLALCLSLCACGGTPAAPAASSPDTSAPEQSGSAEAVVSNQTASGSLEELAGTMTPLQGQDFPGSVWQDKEGDAILYDSSQVPTEALGCAIADLDGDGSDELVAAVLNDDHSFRLELYEEQDGKAVKTDTLDLKDEFAEIPQIIGGKTSPSIADFFTYEPEDGQGVKVGLEISQTAGVFVDGVKLDFLAVSCQNGALHLDAHASTSGSDGVYSSGYMDLLADEGLYPQWTTLFERSHYVRECAKGYQDFARITTNYSVDYTDANEWLAGDAAEPMPCSTIHINSQAELEQNTRDVQALYQAPPEHARALQRYEAALVRFSFDHQWPDGTSFEDEIDYNSFNFEENQYAIQDVNGDGAPELLIQFSQTFVAAQMENVYRYDEESDSLIQELSVYPFCTYYNTGVVKSNAAHNHTPSEFWPFTLWAYNAETRVFEDQGSVYAQDKDSDFPSETPFPADVDQDGDGRVFYLNEDAAVDNAAYEEWERSVLKDGKELSINWHGTDYTSYDSIMTGSAG